ncbi:hypothetical protein HLB44_17910 [Aquincola sp. S2]|uniref:DNA binding HTH domain-containing protein n=2 Tax=Pseudaquabacterium terrae TaxID=2732868 RepID=A0ABX2EJX4_9BURK|nr:hypothetical protein [Aquabacterium terrae]
MTHKREPHPQLLPNGLTVWLQAEFRPLGDNDDDDTGVVTPAASAAAPAAEATAPASEPPGTLAQLSRQLVDQTLAACDGNVSRAARRLGVSRGLLYRRLRAG